MEEEKKTNTVKRLIPKGKEFILFRDDKTGFELQLISSTQSMEELLQTALNLKVNLLDDKKEVVPEYIQ